MATHETSCADAFATPTNALTPAPTPTSTLMSMPMPIPSDVHADAHKDTHADTGTDAVVVHVDACADDDACADGEACSDSVTYADICTKTMKHIKRARFRFIELYLEYSPSKTRTQIQQGQQ